MRRRILSLWNQTRLQTRTHQHQQTRPDSSKPDNKSTLVRSSNNNQNEAESSLTTYEKHYNALSNLDPMKAIRILFSDPPKKKKFGLDFHLVQFFFACLPSLAVYLVALYARSEMRKMDAELEKKKQAEFEEQAKEMERKAAKEKAAAASDTELLEFKERLGKLEEAIKEIVVESKKTPCDVVKKAPEDGKEQKIPGGTAVSITQHTSEVGKTSQ